MDIISLLGGIRATVFATVAALLLIFSGYQTYRVYEYKENEQQVAVAVQAARAKAEAEARATESALQRDKSHIQSTAFSERVNAQAIQDRLLADLATGQRKLREKFTCPIPASATAGAERGVEAGTQAGLSTADAEFLVRFAGDADKAVIERNEAVQMYEAAKKRLEEYGKSSK